MRRTGRKPVLSQVDVGEFLALSDNGVARRKGVQTLSYLCRVAGIQARNGEWKQVRETCRELRRLDPKRYVRGKFEAWFLLSFIRRLLEELSASARESGGSITVSAQLSDSNVVQLLVRAVPVPQPLASFLEFHFKQAGDASTVSVQTTAHHSAWRRLNQWVRRHFRT
jgi:hypothetical protein